MVYALTMSAALVALVLPVLAGLVALTPRAASGLERTLGACIVLPLLLLAEIFVANLLPGERPLRWGVPTLHALVLVGALAVLIWRWREVERDFGLAWHRGVRWLRALDWASRMGLAIGVALLALAFVNGAWNAGDEHDGGAYREVMAVAAYQDGRVRSIEFPFWDFADSYPRTIELLCSWTMLVTRSNVGFHLVNWYGLVVLALATAAIARRLHVSRRGALWNAILVATTPIAIYLTWVLYNDVPSAAPVAGGLAFALAPRRRTWGWFDLTCMVAGLTLGAAAKLQGTAAAAVVGALCVARVHGARSGERERSAGARFPGPAWVAAMLLAGACVAAIPYVRSWVLYGSPTWAVQLRMGPWVLFDGPFDYEHLRGHAQGSWLARWWTAAYKLFQNVSQDSNGGFGVAFAAGVVPGVIAATLAWFRRPRQALAIALAVFWVYAASPVASTLRYSIPMLAAGYPIAFALAERSTRAVSVGRRRVQTRRVLACVLLVAALANAFEYLRITLREFREQRAHGVSLLDPERNRRWYEQYDWIKPGLAPGAFRAVQERVGTDERLAYCVMTIPAFLYDPAYRYAIEFRSIAHYARRKLGARAESAEAVASAWLRSLVDDRIDCVLVYRGSSEDAALSSARDRFEVSLDQADIPERGVRLYRAVRPRETLRSPRAEL